MPDPNLLPKDFSQNNQLPIRIVSADFGHLSAEAAAKYGLTHRLQYYFFLFVVDGTSSLGVGLDKFEIGKHELLFSLPHKIQQFTDAGHGIDYYKPGFD